jgi:hypothetical protein
MRKCADFRPGLDLSLLLRNLAPLDTNWKKATVLMARSVGADNQPLTPVRSDFDIFPQRRQGVGRRRFGRGGWGQIESLFSKSGKENGN